MEIKLFTLLKDHSELVLFVLLALAYLIGKIKIGKLELGAPPGMLIAGLILGNFGFAIFPGISTIGLFLFLYAVAFQAGPVFFSVVMTDGLNYLLLAAIATVLGFVLTYGLSLVFQFSAGVPAGLFAGALTTPAGLASALETVHAGEVRLPDTLTVEMVLQTINVTYALTFLVADIAVILLCRNLPGMLGFDLQAESIKAAREKHVKETEEAAPTWALTMRAYRVDNSEIIGKTIAELQQVTECAVLSFKRDGMLMDFEPETPLQLGDVLSIWGKVDHQDMLDDLFGAEVADPELLSAKIVSRDIVINKPHVVEKPIKHLEITERHACHPIKLSRAGMDLVIHPEMSLAQGDILTLSGPQSRLEHLANEIGFFERDVNTTDLLTFSTGIIVGFLIGQIAIDIGGVAIGLGASGGLLLMGLVLGYLRSIHPTFGRVPPATLWVFKELGLLFFLAGVGISAGQGLTTAIRSPGPIVLLCSLVVATLPVIATFAIGRFWMKMNPALLLGAATGAVTCTPAMAAVSEDAKSSIPTVGYAGTYAFATVFCAIAGSIMVRLF